jgi:hypothetical protein
MKILKCSIAPIRVAMLCHYLFHITASFDERKGILYAAFCVCAGHTVDELTSIFSGD